MVDDFETLKIVALFAVFVVLVFVAIAVGIRDARRQKREQEERIQRQLEVLKRAKEEAERRRQKELEASQRRRGSDDLRPSGIASGGDFEIEFDGDDSRSSDREIDNTGNSDRPSAA